MIAKNIINRIIYGNKEGIPTYQGKSSDKYNDFLATIFTKDKFINELPNENTKQNTKGIESTKVTI